MTAAGPALLVVGLTQRTGTNWLDALLGCHPVLRRPRRVREDHLADGAGDLVRGIAATTHHWQPDWLDPHVARDELAGRVGGALLGWLAEDAGVDASSRLLTRTPGTGELGALLHLVGDAHVVLLVRDGRDVVASGMAGLGWTFTQGLDRWVWGARQVLGIVGRPIPPGPRLRLVRYEDLVADLQGTLTALLTWAGLDPDRLDWTAARDLPVLGSSYHRGGAARVHWDPVARPAGFDPRGRASAWSPQQQARFALRAGVEQAALGYPVPSVGARSRAGAAALELGRAVGRHGRARLRGG